MEEESLIAEAKRGNKDALVRLILAKKNEYYRLAYVYVGNSEDALDQLQDMIVTLYENIGKLRKNEAFHSWAKTILINSCKRQLKKNKKIIPLEGIKIDEVSFDNSSSDISLDIRQGLKKLNDYQKEAIILKYYLDLDYGTIAEITKTPIGTVKSRIFNGLNRLRVMMGGGKDG